VPAQLARLVEAAPDDLDVVRRFDRILVGGQATPAPLVERARRLGLAVTRTYGSSETGGGCVYDGAPIGATRVRVVDGEVQLSGDVLAWGYLDDAERTARAFRTDDAARRWYRTGDTGELVDGLLLVTGRLDDVIISGGLKVSLAAVERLLHDLGGFGELVVTSEPHERWGEVPVLVSTVDAPLEAARPVIVERLGRAAVPARVVVVDELPRLSSGKPDRVGIRAAVQAAES
jgi:O-succinylbenzoic acid--CoA ligase